MQVLLLPLVFLAPLPFSLDAGSRAFAGTYRVAWGSARVAMTFHPDRTYVQRWHDGTIYRGTWRIDRRSRLHLAEVGPGYEQPYRLVIELDRQRRRGILVSEFGEKIAFCRLP